MKIEKQKPVICIMGPTASGKTGLAIEAAKQLNTDVVSVDSALIYQDMDIGTAKPDATEQEGIKHHLLDIRNPEQAYSVADFVKDASRHIDDIHARSKIPILAGGTMMYFNALLNGISQIPSSDHHVREKISASAVEHGNQWLHQRLQECDPESAKRIHPNDPQRLIRAMEVYTSTGVPLSEWQNRKSAVGHYHFINFSIMPNDRKQLHERISIRFKAMIEAGLIEEVQMLLKKYQLHHDMPSMRCVGYRQTLDFLDGKYNATEFQERGIIATRQLAKRQITWLRGWKDLYPLDTHSSNNLDIMLQKVCAITG